MRSLNNHNSLKASDAKKSAKVILITLLNHQSKVSEDSLYAMVSWLFLSFFSPRNWPDEKDYGDDVITSFAKHFRARRECPDSQETKVRTIIILINTLEY